MSDKVKLSHAALDDEGGDIVLRGALTPESLGLLKTAPYQREVLPLTRLSDLVKAYEAGAAVPDIDLGMRGHHCTDRDGAYYLGDDVYIIDGLQRVSAALFMMRKGGKLPRLGATVHFGTTEESERNRFRILNQDRARLSPNILLRNLKEDIQAVDALFVMSEHDKDFVLHDRVCWSQRMKRGHLITALGLLRVVGGLHGHFGGGKSSSYHELAPGVQGIMDKVGRNVMKQNISTFFDVIEQAWGIRAVTFKEGAVYMRGTFLQCVARLFSEHENFWRGHRLLVEKDLVRKIAMFPIHDPQVINLASASGKARDLLYALLLQHVNSGRRTRRLSPRTKRLKRVATETKVAVNE